MALKRITDRVIAGLGLGFLVAFLAIYAARSEENYQIKVHETASVFAGTTLFVDKTDLEYQKIVEVDMEGRILWSYDVPQNLFPSGRTQQNSVSDIERLADGNTLFNIQYFLTFKKIL